VEKKRHTLKSQVAVDDLTGQIVDVTDSVPGPTADLTGLKQSDLLARLLDRLCKKSRKISLIKGE
jgi:hypothetical protein